MKSLAQPFATVFSLLAAIALVLLLSASAHAQEVTPLEPGQSLEREITGGQTHRYQISLITGAYGHVEVAERGVNITLVLRGPDGSSLAEMNAAGATLFGRTVLGSVE